VNVQQEEDVPIREHTQGRKTIWFRERPPERRREEGDEGEQSQKTLSKNLIREHTPRRRRSDSASVHKKEDGKKKTKASSCERRYPKT
jgi:hypothetical protein